MELELEAVVAEVAEALADTRLIFLTSKLTGLRRPVRQSIPARFSPGSTALSSTALSSSPRGLASTDEGFEDTPRPPYRGAPCVSDGCAADGPEFAEALRAFCKDVVAAR